MLNFEEYLTAKSAKFALWSSKSLLQLSMCAVMQQHPVLFAVAHQIPALMEYKDMLITNRRAIICATIVGSMLWAGGVITNIYELCDIDLKDFSIQGSVNGQDGGCLLRSYPSDMVFDNSTDYSFTCYLTDNIEAPWPSSSSSLSSVSLCAPEMSMPALPTSETMKNPGACHYLWQFFGVFFFVYDYNLLLIKST